MTSPLEIMTVMPRTLAILLGLPAHGTGTFSLDAEALEALDAPERAQLASSFDALASKVAPLVLDGPDASRANTLRCLKTRLAADAAQAQDDAAKARAQYAAECDLLAALPVDGWLYADPHFGRVSLRTEFARGTWTLYLDRESVRIDARTVPVPRHTATPAVRAAYDAARLECEARNVVVDRERKAADLATRERERERERKAAEHAARQLARETRASAEFLAYALTVPSLARAAQEHYDVTSAVVAHLAAECAAPFPGATRLHDGTKAYELANWTERKSPRLESLELAERIAAHVATLAHPASLELTVSRVLRVDFGVPEYDRPHGRSTKITAVLVTLGCPLAPDCVVVIPAETP